MHNRASNKGFAFTLTLAATAAIALSACNAGSTVAPTLRMETAKRLAGPAHLMETHINAGEFSLMSFERVQKQNSVITVYLEDDGVVRFDDLSVSGDPTPINPVALRMAADDTAPNVVYLGRPCQYVGALNARQCIKALYTTHRFSPQVLDAVNAALDDIKGRYRATGFNLVGVGGGAAVAVEMAAVRNDVKFIRTVAGTLDTRIAAAGHEDDPYSGSLNPIDAAPKVAHIPQLHSTASWDKDRSMAMIKSFYAAEGQPSTAKFGSEFSAFTDEESKPTGW